MDIARAIIASAALLALAHLFPGGVYAMATVNTVGGFAVAVVVNKFTGVTCFTQPGSTKCL
jgi:hypothetical protein